MKSNELNLELQAYADGQLGQLPGLPVGRRAELERLLAGDPESRALVEGIRSFSQTLRANEPIHEVPASREFYWSQIKRQIDAAERERDVPSSSAQVGWQRHGWRWGGAVFGLAAIAVAILMASRGSVLGEQPGGDVAVSEKGSESSEAVVFRSELEGVTICWLD